MTLAGMIYTDRNALLCDLAETYGIYDIKAHPATRIALFSAGLRDNSRIKMKMSGRKVSDDLLLLAHAVDRLSLLVWAQTKDGQKNRHKPDSIADYLLHGDKTNKRKGRTFDTPDEFWKARQKIIDNVKGGEENGR